MKTEPNMAKKVRVMPALAALNRGLRKNPKSSIGWSQCNSHQAKPTSRMAAITKTPTVIGSVQPWRGASMMAKSRAPSPVIESTAPSGSNRGAAGSLESGMRKTPAISPTRTMGRFTRNTEPQ